MAIFYKRLLFFCFGFCLSGNVLFSMDLLPKPANMTLRKERPQGDKDLGTYIKTMEDSFAGLIQRFNALEVEYNQMKSLCGDAAKLAKDYNDQLVMYENDLKAARERESDLNKQLIECERNLSKIVIACADANSENALPIQRFSSSNQTLRKKKIKLETENFNLKRTVEGIKNIAAFIVCLTALVVLAKVSLSLFRYCAELRSSFVSRV